VHVVADNICRDVSVATEMATAAMVIHKLFVGKVCTAER